MFGDAQPSAQSAHHVAMPDAPPDVDVVLITIDSLRVDHVGAYAPAYAAAGLATTPALDDFARDALVFDRAYTSGGWTSIAVSSLMRGVFARQLQWTRMYETSNFRLLHSSERSQLQPLETIVKMFPLPLSDRHATLASILSRRGMQTLAVADDSFSELLSRDSGVASGFRRYEEVDDLPAAQRDDSGTATRAIELMAGVPNGRRFFLWVHFFGPHSPNTLHPGVRLDGNQLVQGYDHEIRYADLQLARLLHAIESRRTPTAVFVTADHGEEFIGDGRHHGFSVSDAAIHVPLLARVPGWARGRSSVTTSLIDLMPTILRLTGTPPPAALDGIALQDRLDRPARSRVIFADTWQYDRVGRALRMSTAALDDRRKVVFDQLLNSWSVSEPASRDTPARPISAHAPDPLVHALSGYVDRSGGQIKLRD
jgi:arylsulfatase A-like enzyme